MPRDSAHAPQFPLFVHDTMASPEAFVRYEAIRPVLKGERSLPQQSHQTEINYWRLWRDLRRFQRAGLLGLLDQRTRAYRRGKPAVQDLLPRPMQQHIVRLAIAHPFTARELARMPDLKVTNTHAGMLMYVTLDAIGRSDNKAMTDPRVRTVSSGEPAPGRGRIRNTLSIDGGA